MNKTAEEIFNLIASHSIDRDLGIKLIENYGIRQQRKLIEKAQNDLGGYSAEIETAINIINAKLDEMLKNTINACTRKEGL